MYAITTIKSYTGKIYAPLNAEVSVVHHRGNVLICEYNGDRFPCTADKLGEDMVIIEEVIEVKPQLSLF